MKNDDVKVQKSTIREDLLDHEPRADAYWVKTTDDVRLRIGCWQNQAPEQSGTILFFPGRAEYFELTSPLADELTILGYSVVTLDWRGQGLSDRLVQDRKVGYVNSFADYQKDVEAFLAFVKEQDFPKPIYVMGHSMGACIALRAMQESFPFVAAAFTAPMWGIHLSHVERLAIWPVSWISTLIGAGAKYVPGADHRTHFEKFSFEDNGLTNDKEMYEFWLKQAQAGPELQIGGPSMKWTFEALKECRALTSLQSPDIPCLVFCGDQDHIVDQAAISKRTARWPKATFTVLPGAKHELYLEQAPVRKEIVAQVHSFFQCRN